MTTKYILILIAIPLLFGCGSNLKPEEKTKTINSKLKFIEVDDSSRLMLVNIGDPISRIDTIYTDQKIIKEPLYTYGIDSESLGHTVINNNEKSLFIWTMDNSDPIAGIEILNDDIIIEPGVKVGMSLNDFSKIYPDFKIYLDALDYDSEFLQVENLGYSLIFETSDTNRVAKYETPQSVQYSTVINRYNAKIDRISIEKE